ncbi:hypothetical protein GCM10010531_32870 [Blastococcus jejuensis]|uniref:Mycothiol-dependent maleylpyruvate isomerase metal-binding domain-containing protein n=2 Tax=Blastococcus jejuensis TaxID=351224 RepID=A0ABP6PH83_9ACTN
MRHRDWMAAAEEEYRRLGALLAELDAADWARPTDCSEWDVREVVAHLVGAAESTASVRELRRQQKLGRALRPGEADVDGMNAVQVRERADATPEQLRLDLVDAGTRGVRARRRLPGLLRALPIPFGPPLGTRPLGYLTDRIYTRDAWMHRIDIARATGRALALTAAHDGRIVADVVGEWARAHRQPHRLTLTGPAGGTWSAGVGGEEMALDAVEFCRTVSGRAPGAGLLAHPVPF